MSVTTSRDWDSSYSDCQGEDCARKRVRPIGVVAPSAVNFGNRDPVAERGREVGRTDGCESPSLKLQWEVSLSPVAQSTKQTLRKTNYMLRLDATNRSNHSTMALCSQCGKLVACNIRESGGKVYLSKLCNEHGLEEVVLSTDSAYWHVACDVRAHTSPQGNLANSRAIPYMVIVEIVDECDLECPTCIAGSLLGGGNFRKRADIHLRLYELTERIGQLDLIMISGGEPALHPELLGILEDTCGLSRQVMLITNGIRIASDPDFAASLAKLGSMFQVYLQFDSLQGHVLEELRGRDLRLVRLAALRNLAKANVGVTLICVIKNGFNDRELAQIVEFACQFPNIRGVTFQPIRATGRHSSFDYSAHSIPLSRLRQRLLRDLSLVDSALVPHPVNPERICIGYIRKSSIGDRALTPLVYNPDAITPEHDRGPLYMPPSDLTNATGVGVDHILRLAIVSFLDQYDFTTEFSEQEGVCFLSDSGELVAIDRHYRLYNGVVQIDSTTRERNEDMETQSQYSVIITTVSTPDEADALARVLLEKRLVACIQVQSINSYYTWKGEPHIDPELLLLIKTRGNLYEKVRDLLLEIHPYETPEIVQLPIVAGSQAYLRWIDEVTGD